jgi:hypothetical protein
MLAVLTRALARFHVRHKGAKIIAAATPQIALTGPTTPQPALLAASSCNGYPAATAPTCPTAFAKQPAVDLRRTAHAVASA